MAADIDQQKLIAARAAVARVERGMRVALGTGSTAAFAVRLLSEKFPDGGGITTVASSLLAERLARDLGLPIGPPAPKEKFDVMLDGADEVTPTLALTKGGGGALFREKLLAGISTEMLVIVDHTKLVDRLGSRAAIPIEVVPYSRSILLDQLAELRIGAELRHASPGVPFITDNGNEILDLRVPGAVDDPAVLDATLRGLTGVVETGIFPDQASRVYVGLPDGTVQEILPAGRAPPTPRVPAGARVAAR